jgi:hypothetical protein
MSFQIWAQKINGRNENENGKAVSNLHEPYCDFSLWR